MKNRLFGVVMLVVATTATAQGKQLPAGVELMKDYRAGSWTWKVAVVPQIATKQDLVRIANDLHAAFPSQRIRLFDDKAKLQQFIGRDIWFNDTSGRAKEVPFPEQWTVKHHLANINDRSESSGGRWQLVTRHGKHLAFLGTKANSRSPVTTVLPIDGDAQISDQVRRNSALQRLLVNAIRSSGYRCDSFSAITEMAFSPGYNVTCNEWQYRYEVEGKGGMWRATLD